MGGFLERHEAAWREEALVSRSLSTDLDSHKEVVAQLSKLLQSTVRDAANHEDTACTSEKRSHSLELELHAQLPHLHCSLHFHCSNYTECYIHVYI